MSLAQDLRFAFRGIRRNPGFTLVVVLTLGIGIGATSAIFTLVNGVLLRPLPFPNSDQLVNLWEASPKRNIPKFTVTPANYYDWKAESDVFSSMGAYQQSTFNLDSNEGEPERYVGAACDPGFFATLQVAPVRGRLFTEDEDQPGHDGVVILSYGLWQQRFAGDPGIIGKQLLFEGRPRIVLGIMPENFEYPLRAKMWAPLALDPETKARRDFHRLRIIARLRDGATLEKARNEFNIIGQRLAQEHPNSNKDSAVLVVLTRQDLVGPLRAGLLSMLGAVIFVLLILCATLANLLIAKAASRQREIAIRTSLGAGRFTILQQMLTEATLLSLLGGLVAMGIAVVVFRTLILIAPRNLPRLDQVSLDWRMLGIIAAISLVTGLVFGLAPAIYASRNDLVSLLKQGSAGAGLRSRVRPILVVFQMAVALILLTGAGLLMRTFYEINHEELGFDPNHVITMRLAPAPSKYKNQDERLIETARSILREVSALPDVKSAAIGTDTPLLGSSYVSLRFENGAPVSPSQAPPASILAVSPGYVESMGMRLINGRFFTEQDSPTSPLVVVINESIAKRYFKNSNPVGQRIALEFSNPAQWREIVGVVADVKSPGFDDSISAQIYAPYLQRPSQFGSPVPVTVLARTSKDPTLVAAAMKRSILSVDRSQPVYDIQPMTDTMSQLVAQRRFSLVLLAFFALAALVLAALGLHGLLSLAVTQSAKEIGIRMALGAQRSNVLLMLQRRGMVLIMIGLAIGVAGELALTRLLGSLLFHVSPLDTLALTTAALLLITVSALASYLPARRAANLDPLVSLRNE
jgi:putative ABC transport system permease protein